VLIQIGKIYTHADGGMYKVLDTQVRLKSPDTGEWHLAVLYKGYNEQSLTYVRTQGEFAKRFKMAQEQPWGSLTDS